MPVYLTDIEETHAPAKTFVVHVKRPGATVKDAALCGNVWGSYVTADSDDALPYIITGLEVLCVECRDRQMGDYDDPLGNTWERC